MKRLGLILLAASITLSMPISGCTIQLGDDFLEIEIGNKDKTSIPQELVYNDALNEEGETQSTFPSEYPGFSDSRNPTLGIAFGSKYENQEFIDHVHELGISQTYINIWWDETEAVPGEYNYTLIDSFIAQLKTDTVAMLRITTRYNDWATSDDGKTIPTDLSIGSPYYNYVYNVVRRTNGKVIKFENNWEADFTKHWGGTAGQYAELSKTFYRAVKDADPEAVVVMGGAIGHLTSSHQEFWKTVFDCLANDAESKFFDVFDVHLYSNLYDIPERVNWFRETLDAYPEFNSIPIIVTEYGGPSPKEFEYVDKAAYADLINELRNDRCLIAGDLTSTPLHPEGYPDQLRMFAYGIEPGLEAKRDRIQGRQMVQRTILALSAGVDTLYWWNIKENSANTARCHFRHPVFGKMPLMEEQQDGTLIPGPTFYFFQIMADYLNYVEAVDKIDTTDPNIFLFEVTQDDGSKIFTIWEKRDQFDGENMPPTEFKFEIPWQNALVQELFSDLVILSSIDREVTLYLTDTPLFIEEAN